MKPEEMELTVKLTKWQQVALALSTYLPDTVHEEVKIALGADRQYLVATGWRLKRAIYETKSICGDDTMK